MSSQSNSQQPNFYDTLEVSHNASDDAIKSSYRRLSLLYHPDVNKTPEASAKFTEINEAFYVLSDSSRRKQYDVGNVHDIVVQNSNLAKIGRGMSLLGRGLKVAGRAYVGALNNDDIQKATGRLYRSNMYALTGSREYLEKEEPQPRTRVHKPKSKKKSAKRKEDS